MMIRLIFVGCTLLSAMCLGCTPVTPASQTHVVKFMPNVKAKLRDPYGTTSAADIRAFEKSIGHDLPDDYRNFLLANNGGEFHDYVCTPGSCGVSYLKGLNTGLKYADLRRARVLNEGFVPADWLQIASDAGGDLICMKLAVPDAGTIASVSHEEAFEPHKIAGSFREFIDSLILDPDILADVESHPYPAFRPIDWDDVAELSHQLDGGLSVEEADAAGKTLLMHAAWKCRLEIVQLLLDRGADVQARDHQEWTPIHYAVATHSPSCIRLLVKHGANVNDKDNEGESLLIYAADNASIRSLQTLLELGADVNYRGPDGKTALGCCWDKDLIAILRVAGAKK